MTKLSNIVRAWLEQVEQRILTGEVRLDGWEVRNAAFVDVGKYEYAGDGWRKVDVGDVWAKQGQTAFMRATVTIPKEWEGRRVGLEMKTGGEGLLLLDGLPYHGVDDWRGYILLSPRANGGEEHRLEIEIKTGGYWEYLASDSRQPCVLSQARLVAIDYAVEQLCHDFRVVFEAAQAVNDSLLQEAMLTAAKKALGMVDLRTPDHGEFAASLSRAVDELKSAIAAIRYADCPGKALLVGHSHIDVAWLWPLKETVRKVGRTYSTLVALMDEFPHYRFVCSQVPLFVYLKQHYPGVYEQVKSRVAEGRFELVGGTWVEHDCNVPSGESLVRQCLYGKRFFRDEFGVDVRVGWLPDVFGYSWALPQIYKKAGLDYFMTSKLTWNDTNRIPHTAFQWQGVDGTRMVTHMIHGSYNAEVKPDELLQIWADHSPKLQCPEFLVTYGYGDGGGGPTRSMLEHVARLSDLPGLPKVRTGAVHELFQRIADRAEDLPVWNGELYYEMHRGTYTSQAWNKRYNRLSELSLRDAEMWGSLSALHGFAYPKDEFARHWQTVLLNQFHDVLPGSSIGEVYTESHEQYREVLAAAQRLRDAALSKLAADIDTQGAGASVVVYNSLSWSRTDVVSTEIKGEGACRVIAPDGSEAPSWVSDHKVSFLAKDVPSCGFAVYQVVCPDGEPAGVGADENAFTVDGRTITSEFYEVQLGPDGTLARLYDRVNGREVIPQGARGNVLQVFDDRPSKEEAWDIELHYQDKGWEFEQTEPAKVSTVGPSMLVVDRKLASGASTVSQRMVLYAHSPRIDFINEVDWQERKAVLKVAFPVNVHSPRATYEIAFGAIERPTHWNTSWDLARFEVSGHRWADLSETGYGVSVLNDCKYGWDIKDNVIRLTLLRAPGYPDPDADRGKHVFTYSLLPHRGDWTESTVRSAAELNVPMVASVAEPHPGELGTRRSFVTTDSPNVIVDTVKRAEDGDELVVRAYESTGARGPVCLSFDRGIKSAVECNLLEDKIGAVEFDESSVRFEVTPYDVRTFRVALR